MSNEINTVIALEPADAKRLRERITMASAPSARLVSLKDRTLLFFSSMRFDRVDGRRDLVAKWLLQTLGKDFPFAQPEARGIAIFPDRCKPKAKTYDGLIKELGAEIVWVPVTLEQLKRQHAAQNAKRASQAKKLRPRSSNARSYEGGELIDEDSGEIVQTRRHTDAPDKYEAELAALGLGSSNSSKSPFDDEDSEEDYDEDDDDEDNHEDRIEDDDELLEFGLDEPKLKVSKSKATTRPQPPMKSEAKPAHKTKAPNKTKPANKTKR